VIRVTRSGVGPTDANQKESRYQERRNPLPSARTTRAEAVIELLTRKEGVSIAEMQEAFGWEPHSCRGLISTVNNKHRLGVTTARRRGPWTGVSRGEVVPV
jgi:hypothetical protein